LCVTVLVEFIHVEMPTPLKVVKIVSDLFGGGIVAGTIAGFAFPRA
jgi:hypothetical protein